jgi:hypothetical protein
LKITILERSDRALKTRQKPEKSLLKGHCSCHVRGPNRENNENPENSENDLSQLEKGSKRTETRHDQLLPTDTTKTWLGKLQGCGASIIFLHEHKPSQSTLASRL